MMMTNTDTPKSPTTMFGRLAVWESLPNAFKRTATPHKEQVCEIDAPARLAAAFH